MLVVTLEGGGIARIERNAMATKIVGARLVSDQRRVRLLEQEGTAFVSKTGLASKHIENAQKRYEYDTEKYRNNEVVCAGEEWAEAFFGGGEGREEAQTWACSSVGMGKWAGRWARVSLAYRFRKT